MIKTCTASTVAALLLLAAPAHAQGDLQDARRSLESDKLVWSPPDPRWRTYNDLRAANKRLLDEVRELEGKTGVAPPPVVRAMHQHPTVGSEIKRALETK